MASQSRPHTLETLFLRHLQQVSNRIHNTDRIEQIMLDASVDICRLFNADRLTLYAVSADGQSIVSRVKTGLNTSSDLKLPIDTRSIAGFVAHYRQQLNIADVNDAKELKAISPELNFLHAVDKRTGYRSKQMLVVPIEDEGELHGVLQLINNRDDRPFGSMEVDGAQQLCETLAIAFRKRRAAATAEEAAPNAAPAAGASMSTSHVKSPVMGPPLPKSAKSIVMYWCTLEPTWKFSRPVRGGDILVTASSTTPPKVPV